MYVEPFTLFHLWFNSSGCRCILEYFRVVNWQKLFNSNLVRLLCMWMCMYKHTYLHTLVLIAGTPHHRLCWAQMDKIKAVVMNRELKYYQWAEAFAFVELMKASLPPQILNLTQALRDRKTPVQLVQMPCVVVERSQGGGQGRIVHLSNSFTQTVHCRKPFFSSW